jgi:hypothetical protein
MNAHSTNFPPSFLTRFLAALAVPAVAIRSSTINTLSPFFIESLCISILSLPYSRLYSSLSHSAGSLPGLRTGTKPVFNK